MTIKYENAIIEYFMKQFVYELYYGFLKTYFLGW